MATEQVQQWIQNDCRLSKIVQSFETDFSNGYLFGEILKQYQYVEDMQNFSKKTNKEAKVKNFQQIENILRKLKVKFDAKLINQIMNEERGAALRLLYQIKLGIQKDNPQEFNMQSQASKTITNLDPEQVNRKLEEVLQLKTTLPNTAKFQTMNKSKKLDSIEKTLLKFEHTKRLQDDKAYNDQKLEEQLIRKLQQDQRQLSMNKMSENKQFMKDWEAEGKKNWRNNQQKRQDTIARQQHFEDLEVKAFKDKLNKELDEATRDMMGGIQEFENNLQKLGIEKNTNIEDAMKRMEEKRGIPPGQIQNFSYAATMNKIKENKNLQDFAAKERDRRRRKMIVDQARTQNNLDKKKNEEQLIQKLMQKQGEEQQFAYLEWRNQQCKSLIIKNREEKALQYEQMRQLHTQELERKRNEEHDSMIENHRKQIQDQKKFYKDVRRQEKLEKRQLNIEICSEIVDLIVDVANEAYEKTQKRDKAKLEKPEWREWMEIFKQNKMVSSVVGDHANNLSLTLNDNNDITQNENSMYQDPLQDPSKNIQEIIDEMQTDPAYEDMLQYLSVSGMFNLNSGLFDFEWNQMKEENLLEGLNLDFQFLDSLIPQSNPILGYNLGSILENIHSIKSKQSQISMYKKQQSSNENVSLDDIQPIKNLPTYMALKLCILGRKYGGKRTLAKQIADQYAPGKVKIFNMNDIIKECYEYVNPKQQIPDLNEKKKAPAKKIADDPVIADQFAGQDTTEYKQIGQKIKEKLGDNYDFNANLSQPQDLQSVIQDDVLMCALFGERLKLSFPQKYNNEEEMQQNIRREQELIEQLREIEEQNLGGGAVQDKKAKAPPAKGKAAPSNEEQLRAELEQLQKVQVEGWILLDYPRTLQQAKVMEKMFTGYTSLTDQKKSDEINQNERWQKLVTQSSLSTAISGNDNVETIIRTSGDYIQGTANAYLFINTSEQECYRRAQNRKIDPTTGVIYHLEDNPPPENDAKLRDRLQEYHDPDAEHSRLSQQHYIYSENVEVLKQFYSNFCSAAPNPNSSSQKPFSNTLNNDMMTPEHHSGNITNDSVLAVNSCIEINMEGKKKMEAFESMWKEIERVVAVKQAEYDYIKNNAKERMEIYEREKLKSAQQQPVSQEDNLQQEILSQKEASEEERKNILTPHQDNTLELKSQASQNKSFSSLRLKSHTRELPPQPLTKQEKQDAWKLFEESYYKENMQVFKTIRRQKDLVFDGLIEIQNRYIEYLGRPDQKQQKVHDFIESFNKFSEEFPDLRQDEQTKEELLKRVDNLNNELWAITEKRKDEALEEHQRIIGNGWIQHEMRKLIRNAITLIQNELNKFNTFYKIQVGFESQSKMQVEQVFNALVDEGTEPFDKNGKSPLLQKVNSSIIKLMQYQLDNLTTLNDQDASASLKIEIDNVLYRLNMISTWITLRLKEFYNYSQQVYDTMDDWVAVAVAEENTQIRKVIEKLSNAIYVHQLRLDYHTVNIGNIDFNQIIELVRYNPQQSKISGGQVDNSQRCFKIEHLEEMYNKMKSMSDGSYLDGQTFIHIIVQALQENKVPPRWRYLEFHQFNRLVKEFKILPLGQKDESHNIYSSRDIEESRMKKQHQREFVDWKKALSAFLLMTIDWTQFDTNLNSGMNQIIDKLMAYADERQEVILDNFLKVEQFFENTNDLPDIRKHQQNHSNKAMDDDYDDEEDEGEQIYQIDYERLKRFKTLLFQLNMNNTKTMNINKYCDNLIQWVARYVQQQQQDSLYHSLFQDI